MWVSSRNAVNIILFWDNPMMGSAYPADGIWHPRYRQIRPYSRPGRLLRAHGWGSQGRRANPARPRPASEKTAILCGQIRGRRTSARCRGIYCHRPCPWRGSAQVDGRPCGRWQRQIGGSEEGCLQAKCLNPSLFIETRSQDARRAANNAIRLLRICSTSPTCGACVVALREKPPWTMPRSSRQSGSF